MESMMEFAPCAQVDTLSRMDTVFCAQLAHRTVQLVANVNVMRV